MNFYDNNSERLFERYQSIAAETVHRAWLDLLPSSPGSVCDIGAGSGRDAGWLASNGWEVTAVEPSRQLRPLGEAFTSQLPNLEKKVLWLTDSLPKLEILVATRKKFDLLILSAVWMHLPTSQHLKSMAILKNLLNQHGLLVITLRKGPDPEKRFFQTNIEELTKTALSESLTLVRKQQNQRDVSRPEISWDIAVFTLNHGIGSHGVGL